MLFKFRAQNQQAQIVDGLREGANKFEIADTLKREGLLVLGVDEISQKKIFDARRLFSLSIFSRVSLEEKMIFARNLSVMVGAGLSFTKALDALVRQSKNKYFKDIVSSLADGIRQGKTFSETLFDFPDVFPSIFRAMIAAGEKAGNLEEVLQMLAEQMRRDYVLMKKIKGAMMYPAVIVFAMFGIAILMMIYVVPSLVDVLEQLNVELPVPTRIIIALSNFVTTRGWFAALIVAALVVGFAVGRKQPFIRKFTSQMWVQVPVVRALAKKMYAARIARSLGSLLSAGVSMVESLDIVSDVVGNVQYQKTLREARDTIQKGGKISSVFSANPRLYPDVVGEIMSVGEETGKLSDVLEKLATFYENEVESATKDLATIIEPVLMIIVGAAVGFFALSILQPMYSVVNAL